MPVPYTSPKARSTIVSTAFRSNFVVSTFYLVTRGVTLPGR
nr:hypothetical protein [Undibacter mobilis]